MLAQLLAYPQRPLDAQVIATALPDAELVGLFPPEAQRQLPSSLARGITVGFQLQRASGTMRAVPHFSPPVVPSHHPLETLFIVIPCFNEEDALPQLEQRLPEVLDKLATRFAKVEVLFVHDGSTDRTLQLLRERFSQDRRFRVLVHERNRGLGAALRTGFSASHSDVVVTTDADGTYEFGEILGMTALLTSDIDIVTASPYHPEGGVDGVPAYRRYLSRRARRSFIG